MTNDEHKFLALDYYAPDDASSLRRSQEFLQQMLKRRSVREFSNRPVDYQIIENCIKTAASAPSGANKQPWTFCVIGNKDLKKIIREEAEKEEYTSYHGRMSDRWLEDLKPFGTDWNKPFLEVAPWIVVVFKKTYDLDEGGTKHKNYYVNESVGIACGMLISAIHQAGLVTLTHTPSPMNFLAKILERPQNEKPYLLLPIGYPAEDATVPAITKKTTEEILIPFK